jgi:hypothetical protein
MVPHFYMLGFGMEHWVFFATLMGLVLSHRSGTWILLTSFFGKIGQKDKKE